MRILPHISFELGGLALLGVFIALLMHFTPLPDSLQAVLSLIYGVTAALWIVGRVTYFIKRGAV